MSLTHHLLFISPDPIPEQITAVFKKFDTISLKTAPTIKQGVRIIRRTAIDLVVLSETAVTEQTLAGWIEQIRSAGYTTSILWFHDDLIYVFPPSVHKVASTDVTMRGGPSLETLPFSEDTLVEILAAKLPKYFKLSTPSKDALISFEDPQNSGDPELAAFTKLRLDTAVPQSVIVGQAFDLAVAVRQPTSPILHEPDLPQVDEGDIQVEWPQDLADIRLTLAVSAPNCDIHGPPQRSFKLYRGQDSPDFFFHLTAKQAGNISIIVTVYQAVDWLGSARLKTEAVSQLAGRVETTVVSQTLSQDDIKRLHGNLTTAFNVEELRTLCLSLGIEYEEFSDRLSVLARELIRYCRRHQKMAALLQECENARPNLYWRAAPTGATP